MLLLLQLLLAVLASSEARARHHPEELNDKALEQLLQVFGLPEHITQHRHQSPPQFMLDLYNTIADEDGVTRAKNPYGATVVRSYIERDNVHDNHFFFNLSGLEEHETILEAELHLYRLKEARPLHHSPEDSPYYLLRVYQVLEDAPLNVPDAHRLLAVHYVESKSPGWEVFNVKAAVTEWRESIRPNLGLLVTASTLWENQVQVRFARQNHHHNSKQPILVLFDDDQYQQVPTTTPVPTLDARLRSRPYHHTLLRESEWNEVEIGDRKRRKRQQSSEDEEETTDTPTVIPPPTNATTTTTTTTEEPQRSEECTRHDMQVSFESIGWEWIIAPRGYNAFECRGSCNFPLGQQSRPTNHATVQSIVHELRLHSLVRLPCCVPHKLLSLSLLYYDEHNNVVLKQYEDMVADSCACH